MKYFFEHLGGYVFIMLLVTEYLQYLRELLRLVSSY